MFSFPTITNGHPRTTIPVSARYLPLGIYDGSLQAKRVDFGIYLSQDDDQRQMLRTRLEARNIAPGDLCVNQAPVYAEYIRWLPQLLAVETKTGEPSGVSAEAQLQSFRPRPISVRLHSIQYAPETLIDLGSVCLRPLSVAQPQHVGPERNWGFLKWSSLLDRSIMLHTSFCRLILFRLPSKKSPYLVFNYPPLRCCLSFDIRSKFFKSLSTLLPIPTGFISHLL
jgi:hypothetical protein